MSLRINISNTRKSVSSDIQTLRGRLKKRGIAEFSKRLRGVWISDETHFRVFDMASQMINNSWSFLMSLRSRYANLDMNMRSLVSIFET